MWQLQLGNILTDAEIEQLRQTQNIEPNPSSSLGLSIAQILNYLPFVYEWAVVSQSKRHQENIESPLKTIIITSWLCHAITQGKLTYKDKPIRLKMDDFLARHIWSIELHTTHYSMCVESLYLLYRSSVGIETDFLSIDQLRVYPVLNQARPSLKGKQRSYLKVKERICQTVEQSFAQHNLYLPIPPKIYNPLNPVDVNDWFTKVLTTNDADYAAISQDVQNYVSMLKVVCDHHAKPKQKERDPQPVWINF